MAGSAAHAAPRGRDLDHNHHHPVPPIAVDMSGNEPSLAYETRLGRMYQATIEEFLTSPTGANATGTVQMLFTSPPFPLNRKKRYGNHKGEEYLEWFVSLADSFRNLLMPDGSVVVEMGNAWEPGRPIMSTLALRALLGFLDKGQFVLCQQFVCHNPARLPTPTQWVNVDRIRVKDSFTHIWWMATSDRPKANNRRVLRPYSDAMRELLRRGTYNTTKRPSQHSIGKTSFLKDNGGSIPSNVLEISNTASSDDYLEYCRQNTIQVHPARMQPSLAEFFVKFLTDEGDLVFDPFAGSNTTGAAAERLGRHWIAVETREDYVMGSAGRFGDGAVLHPVPEAGRHP